MAVGYGRKDAKVGQKRSGMAARKKYVPKKKPVGGMKTGRPKVKAKNLKRSAIPKKSIMSKRPTKSRIMAVRRSPVSTKAEPHAAQRSGGFKKTPPKPTRKPKVMATQKQARKSAAIKRKGPFKKHAMGKVAKLAASNRGKKGFTPFKDAEDRG